MKKILALLLLVAMVLTFSSCSFFRLLSNMTGGRGDGGAVEAPEESSVTNLWPEGMGGVVEEPEEMPGEIVAPEEPSSQEGDTPMYILVWLERMSGNWFTVAEDGLVCTNFSVSGNEISFNGNTYTMKLTTMESWNWASIDLLNAAGEKVYDMRIDRMESGLLRMSFIYQTNNGEYYNEYQVDRIDINKSNWESYFVYDDYVHVEKNAFGEADYMGVRLIFRLKDSLGEVIPRLSSGAVEFQYTNVRQPITADPANKTYTFGDVVEHSSPKQTSIVPFGLTTVDEIDGQYVQAYGFDYGYFHISNLTESKTQSMYYPVLNEMIRIEGTIYVYNGK